MVYIDTLDPNTTLVPGSVDISACASCSVTKGDTSVEVSVGTIHTLVSKTIYYLATVKQPPLQVTQISNQGRVTSSNALALYTNDPGTIAEGDPTIVTLHTGTISGVVWSDTDTDGTKDSGEPWISGMRTSLTWAGPDGILSTTADNMTIYTQTDANGAYSFGSLQYGIYQVGVLLAGDYWFGTVKNSNQVGSSGLASQTVLDKSISSGVVDAGLYGFDPLAVELASFTAEPVADGVALRWETVSEQDNAGFNLYRAASEAGPWAPLNDTLIPAATPGSSEGHSYAWTDTTAQPDTRYFYRLDAVDRFGVTTVLGTARTPVTGPEHIWLPLIVR